MVLKFSKISSEYEKWGPITMKNQGPYEVTVSETRKKEHMILIYEGLLLQNEQEMNSLYSSSSLNKSSKIFFI